MAGQIHVLAAFLPGREPFFAHCKEGWVVSTACLEALEKRQYFCPSLESNHNSSVLQTVA